eukprot:62319-Chlamydomonas_euryale.AAC.3
MCNVTRLLPCVVSFWCHPNLQKGHAAKTRQSETCMRGSPCQGLKAPGTSHTVTFQCTETNQLIKRACYKPGRAMHEGMARDVKPPRRVRLPHRAANIHRLNRGQRMFPDQGSGKQQYQWWSTSIDLREW